MNTPTNLVTLKFETAKGHNWQLTPFDLDASQEIVEHQIDQSIRKNGQLSSRDIDWMFDFDDMAGIILVGGVRIVGTIKAIPLNTSLS